MHVTQTQTPENGTDQDIETFDSNARRWLFERVGTLSSAIIATTLP